MKSNLRALSDFGNVVKIRMFVPFRGMCDRCAVEGRGHVMSAHFLDQARSRGRCPCRIFVTRCHPDCRMPCLSIDMAACDRHSPDPALVNAAFKVAGPHAWRGLERYVAAGLVVVARKRSNRVSRALHRSNSWATSLLPRRSAASPYVVVKTMLLYGADECWRSTKISVGVRCLGERLIAISSRVFWVGVVRKCAPCR